MSENTTNINNNNEEQLSLDDGRRVKVLSPGMMVFKRFIRNKLAIVGICTLVFMFAFSFLGGLISPYRQDQVFYKVDKANKEYAGAVVNTEYRFTSATDKPLSTMTRATFNSKVKNSDAAEVSFQAETAQVAVDRSQGSGIVIVAVKTAQDLIFLVVKTVLRIEHHRV